MVIEIAPVLETLYSLMTLPVSNVLVPAREMFIETALLLLSEYSRSADRPPQPVLEGWSSIEVCHSTCWSLWEKSCAGVATLWLKYWALVRGARSVPALTRTAAFPL